MTIDELLAKMREANKEMDTEERHTMLDNLLLKYIGDRRVNAEFKRNTLWYA